MTRRNRRTKRPLVTLPCVLLALGGVVACGGDETPGASGGSMVAESSPTAESTVGSDGSGNRAPQITSIRLEPADAIPGQRLRVRVAATDPELDPVRLGYTWTVNGRPTNTAGETFDVPADLRKGDRIQVAVVASDGRSNSIPSVLGSEIGNRSPMVEDIQIRTRGTADGDLGQWVADPTGSDPDGDELTFRYRWIVNEEPLDVESAELDREPFRRGDEIRLIVWANDGRTDSPPLESAPFKIENSPPDIVSRPPPTDPSGLFVYDVEANDRDGDRGLRYTIEQGPEGMTIDAFTGALRWQASAEYAGEHVVEVAVDDRHGGVTRQRFYVQVDTAPAARAN